MFHRIQKEMLGRMCQDARFDITDQTLLVTACFATKYEYVKGFKIA